MKNSKYVDYALSFEDSDLISHDFALAIKQRDEKIKEEYEAFSDMYDADGVFTVSIRSTEL